MNCMRWVFQYIRQAEIPYEEQLQREIKMGFLPVSVFVCLANILVFYFSTIRTDIDMEFIHATNSVIFSPPPYNSKSPSPTI